MADYAERQYIIDIIVSLKHVRKKKWEVAEELKLWTDRMNLAEEKDRPDLAAQAARKRARAEEDLSRLQAEEMDILQELRTAKAEMESAEVSARMTVDTDRLLAQLEMVVGKKDETKEAFQDLELDSTLEEMKRSMDIGEDN
jgi:hypothetical protein